MSYKVLIVEDERKIADAIQIYLQPYGYEVYVVEDFTCVETYFAEVNPHLVLLDVNLPYVDGFYLCRKIRESSAVPILFLSARNGDMEKIMGMDSGADDYMTKPFLLEVLHAKVKALLRRTYGELAHVNPSYLQIGELKLGIETLHLCYRDKEVQDLSKNEWKLLHLLMSKPEQVITREECLTALWDDQTFVDDNTLTVNVTRVRKKLRALGLTDVIETKRGIGYQFHSVLVGVAQ
ncbi:response regulator transcription factor [Polycladospora coralii]